MRRALSNIDLGPVKVSPQGPKKLGKGNHDSQPDQSTQGDLDSNRQEKLGTGDTNAKKNKKKELENVKTEAKRKVLNDLLQVVEDLIANLYYGDLGKQLDSLMQIPYTYQLNQMTL